MVVLRGCFECVCLKVVLKVIVIACVVLFRDGPRVVLGHLYLWGGGWGVVKSFLRCVAALEF